MTAPEAFARAAADHRDAIEAVAAALEAVDPAVWRVPARLGKWAPAEIAQHLILAYDPPLSELSGGAGFVLRIPWWKRRLLRWRFLGGIIRRGDFPKGAPAPREIRPRGDAPGQEEGAGRLRENAGVFGRRLAEAHAAGRVRLTHPYFGRLTPGQILKLLAAHAHHHRKQLPGAPGWKERG